MISITAAIVVAVWAVAWAVSAAITRSFEARYAERTSALVDQFRRELERRSEEIERRVNAIARSSEVARIAAQPGEAAQFEQEAQALAAEHSLDLLELVASDGSIISSAHWPARFGYREEWLLADAAWEKEGAFLKREELPDGQAIGMIAVRRVPGPEGSVYVAGGRRLDRQFVNSLLLPEGMRVQLYEFPDQKVIDEIRNKSRRTNGESATLIPLAGRNDELLAALHVLNSDRDLTTIKGQIRNAALLVGSGGVLLGVALSFWAASRVSRPVSELASSVQRVAAGDWNTRAAVESDDEIGRLAEDFNHMTEQLAEQRERMLQAERVAAWRELARRLAHELKNPLFPLQITLENLQRVRERSPDQFEEVFEESTATLLAELEKLKQIIARFSDFSKMLAPRLERVQLNELVRDVMRLFQLTTTIDLVLELDNDVPAVHADPEQISRALRNLVLNAMDAMPAGGRLTIRTSASSGKAAIEVADTGEGLTDEECSRLFTPYYTTKQHGTGLGLAIVQSVVSDHGGSISVKSQPGKGTTFRIELKA
jgi:signal transduction histidine kinase